MDEAFSDGIEAIPPGQELGALLAVWLPRQRALPSVQAVALKRASRRQANHWVALDQASMHEIACRRYGQAPSHAPKPTRSGIAEV